LSLGVGPMSEVRFESEASFEPDHQAATATATATAALPEPSTQTLPDDHPFAKNFKA
jgi:hypothetical protein